MKRILYTLVRLLINLIARVELVGSENLPDTPGYVVAGNHIGRLDAFMVYYVLDRYDIIMLVAEKYEKYAFVRLLVRLIDGIFIDRFNPDLRALREAMTRLQKGGVLTIAPEGTRSKSGKLIQARPGGIYLAWKAGVPILPVAITGTQDEQVIDNLKHFRRLRIRLRAGKSFTLPREAKGIHRSALLQAYTDEVMCRIAALLPEERRGVYADHPRLKEYLEE